MKQTGLSNRNAVKYIGQDHLGNIYFESDRPNHSKQVKRFFQNAKVESFSDIVKAAHVPPAWDAWLRFRRKEPPSDKEVREGEEYFAMQQALAAQKKSSDEIGSSRQDANKSPSNVGDKQAKEIPPGSYRTD